MQCIVDAIQRSDYNEGNSIPCKIEKETNGEIGVEVLGHLT
jgi:hypothetical protein